jgi:hypothetical protein
MKRLSNVDFICILIVTSSFISPNNALAGASALGSKGVDIQTGNFFFRQGTGATCVTVKADPVFNPPQDPGAPCETSTGFGFNRKPGLGQALIKPGNIIFSNSAIGEKYSSNGLADLSYTRGLLVDEAKYKAQTIISPKPGPVNSRLAFARAEAYDPVEFQTNGIPIGISSVLGEVLIDVSEKGSTGLVEGFLEYTDCGELNSYNCSVSPTRIYDFSILATNGFNTIDDLVVFATGSINPNTLKAALVLDPIESRISIADFTLFADNVDFGSGTRIGRISGGLASEVNANVPGPIPIAGAFIAFSCSRKLRHRLKGNSFSIDL